MFQLNPAGLGLPRVGLIGKSATFWIYAFLGVLATGFIWLRVPETKGKSLEQIEQEVGASPDRAALSPGAAVPVQDHGSARS